MNADKKQKRRNHSAEFKARIALEALKGVKTVQQIAAENNLHPIMAVCLVGVAVAVAAVAVETTIILFGLRLQCRVMVNTKQ